MNSLTRLFMLCMLAFSMVFAAVPHRALFNFNLRTQDEETSESVEINFRDSFVKITTPGHDEVQPAVMVHDYSQGLTLFKQNGQCFMMDKFADIPENIEDWIQIREARIGDKIDLEGAVQYKDYRYKALPFGLDRYTLPAAIQRICPGTIHVLVLEETLEGDEAYKQSRGPLYNTGLGEIFLPGQTLHGRVKRQSNWGGGLSGGRNSQGGYINGNVHGNNGRGTSGSLNGGYNFGSRDYNLGGSLSHSSGSWTGTARGSHHSSAGGSLGGSLNYNNGGFSAGIGADHNTRTHDTNVRATVRWDF